MKLQGKLTQNELFASEQAEHHKMPRILIVVADERIARVFKKLHDHLELIGEAFPTHGHHKLGTHQKPSHNDAMNFSHDLSSWLEEEAKADSFDHLVLVAAPKTLGALRPRLHKSIQDRITAEISKELTKMNKKELEEELKEIVWF